MKISNVVHVVCHPRCAFINYVGLINCRTQVSGGRCMLFITYVSTTCFGAYGHLQVDELTKEKHRQLYLACVLYTVEGVLLDGVRDLVLIPM